MNSAAPIWKCLYLNYYRMYRNCTPAEGICFLRFSQAACLTLEYISRNARRYRGVVSFNGGLTGEKLTLGHSRGDFNGTLILLTSGDPDPHVPQGRVKESVKQLQA